MRDVMLIFHFIGLAMGLGTGFAHAFLGSAAAKMSPDESKKFLTHTLVLSNMGHIGITLLLISGFYLITPYWKVMGDYPLLMVKLGLVGVLILLIAMINIAGKKAKQGHDVEKQLKKMKALGKGTLITALAIVIVAVNVFH